MKQLSGLDNIFLAMESKNQYLHIGGLSIYDPSTAPGGKVRFKTILDYFTSRLGVSKVFRRRLATPPFGMDRPYWIEDAEIDIEYHVRHIGLPHPGDWRQLMIQVARIHSRPLDLTKPLWEAYIIEGLDNIPGIAKGSFALYVKVHHSAMDGEMGAELSAAIHTLEPEFDLQPVGADGEEFVGEDEPSLWQYASNALNYRTKQLFDTSKLAVNLTRKAADLSKDYGPAAIEMGEEYLKGLFGRNEEEADSGSDAADDTEGKKRSSKVPQTRFQNNVSPHRVLDAVGLPLAGFKTVRQNIDNVTINDIFLTLVGGAMRRYLDAKGETPESTMRASMPISTRQGAGQDSGNQIGMAITSLHSDITDPIERLMAVSSASTGVKKMNDSVGAELPQQMMNVIPVGLIEKMVPYVMKRSCNVMASNVRGPHVPVYFAGAQLQVHMPFALPLDGNGLSVTGFSCNGVMWMSVTCCREMMPDPAFFVQCIQDDFDALLAAVEK